MKSISEIPQTPWAEEFRDPELFIREFGSFSDEEWLAALNAAGKGGSRLPDYPDAETMRRIHGSPTVESALWEAFQFYRYVRAHPTMVGFNWRSSRLLDFGCGWGRISRCYLRDMPASRIDGFEPNFAFAVLARRLNPYITIFNGGFTPDRTLPVERYDLIVGWSIFSHLSQSSAKAWLGELWRVARPGARLFLTTWGERFIQRMIAGEETMITGGVVDWYTKACIERAGNLDELLKEFRAGRFVFIGAQDQLYGEAFINAGALRDLLSAAETPFEVVELDECSPSQDVIVLLKSRG